MEALKRAMPVRLRQWLGRKRLQTSRNALWLDRVTDFSVLRQVTPYRPAFGWHRGECIDRYYIQQFLASHAGDIRGRVLEVAEPVYTNQFGGTRVTSIDILDLDSTNSKATLHDDLATSRALASDSFDCIICTQTLHCIYDFRAALETLHRILKPGGHLLLTVPGIAQLAPTSMMGVGKDYWRFTNHSTGLIFREAFGERNVTVKTYGNVLAAVGMLHGLVSQEFTPAELDHHDPDYEVIIAVRAVKVPQ